MTQAFVLPRRSRGKPGELPLAVGLVLMLAAPMVIAIVASQDRENAMLMDQGVVSPARVAGHSTREEGYVDRRGRPRVRTVHYAVLDYDPAAVLPYREWRRHGGGMAAGSLATGHAEIEISAASVQQMPVGQATNVVYIPGDAASIALVGQLEYEGSWTYHLWHYLAMGAVFVAGLAMAVAGFRRRFG